MAKTMPIEPVVQPAMHARNEEGSQEYYEKFLPQAEGIADELVKTTRIDAALAVRNYDRRLEALSPYQALIEQLPGMSWVQLEEGRQVARAFRFAADVADRTVDVTEKLAPLLRRGSELRAIALPALQSNAAAGHLKVEEVNAIRSGRGSLDHAGDLVVMAAIFRANETVRQQSPMSPAMVDEMASTGNRLQEALRPKGATPAPQTGTSAVRETGRRRDRLYTLLVDQYDAPLSRALGFVFGNDVDQHAPQLGSRDVPVRKAAETPTADEPAA